MKLISKLDAVEYKFGDFVGIEQKRYGADNEIYQYRVVSTDMNSNMSRKVPFDANDAEHKMGDSGPVLLVANASLTSRDTTLHYVRPCDVTPWPKSLPAPKVDGDLVERLRPTEDEVNERCEEWDGWGFYDAVEEVLERENQIAARDTLIQSLTAERDAMRDDAEKWRAFYSSARFKMMGSANFDHNKYPEVSVKDKPDGWLHFGLEVWDEHPAGDDEQAEHGRNLLDAYVEHRTQAIRAIGDGE